MTPNLSYWAQIVMIRGHFPFKIVNLNSFIFLNCNRNKLTISVGRRNKRLVYNSCDKKGTYPYYVSTAWIGLFWSEIEYLKRAARLLNREWVNRRGSDLPEEVLWVSAGQMVAELLAVKVGGQKNSADWPGSNLLCLCRANWQYIFLISNFDSP